MSTQGFSFSIIIFFNPEKDHITPACIQKLGWYEHFPIANIFPILLSLVEFKDKVKPTTKFRTFWFGESLWITDVSSPTSRENAGRLLIVVDEAIADRGIEYYSLVAKAAYRELTERVAPRSKPEEKLIGSTLEIFCCYARRDQGLLEELKTHMIPLQRQGLITVWSDTDISPGTNWEDEIDKHLNSAHIILLLVSPSFIASEYCYSKEMKRAIDRHKQGEARIIPIILRPVDWKNTPFGKLQCLPTGAIPVTEWRNRSKAFLDITLGIKKQLWSLGKIQQIGKKFHGTDFFYPDRNRLFLLNAPVK
jgi:TIR domain